MSSALSPDPRPIDPLHQGLDATNPTNGPGMENVDADCAFEQYKILLDLWARENPIKTTKLQVLLAVNALLVSVVALKPGPLVTRHMWLVYLVGMAVSLVWTFSIGRTALFQEIWQVKLSDLARAFPNDPRFSILNTKAERKGISRLLRVFGSIPSHWYLLFTPPAFALVWALVLLRAFL